MALDQARVLTREKGGSKPPLGPSRRRWPVTRPSHLAIPMWRVEATRGEDRRHEQAPVRSAPAGRPPLGCPGAAGVHRSAPRSAAGVGWRLGPGLGAGRRPGGIPDRGSRVAGGAPRGSRAARFVGTLSRPVMAHADHSPEGRTLQAPWLAPGPCPSSRPSVAGGTRPRLPLGGAATRGQRRRRAGDRPVGRAAVALGPPPSLAASEAGPMAAGAGGSPGPGSSREVAWGKGALKPVPPPHPWRHLAPEATWGACSNDLGRQPEPSRLPGHL